VDSVAPNWSKVVCITGNAVLASVISSYFNSPGEYFPVMAGPRMEMPDWRGPRLRRPAGSRRGEYLVRISRLRRQERKDRVRRRPPPGHAALRRTRFRMRAYGQADVARRVVEDGPDREDAIRAVGAEGVQHPPPGPRCRLCYMPFEGSGGLRMRAFGRGTSVCSRIACPKVP